MKKQPLTKEELEGKCVDVSREAFDALTDIGFESYNSETFEVKFGGKGFLMVLEDGFLLSCGTSAKANAYYHKGNFYDEPQDDTITVEKVPFPEMDEIEWVMVEAPEWYKDELFESDDSFQIFTLSVGNKYQEDNSYSKQAFKRTCEDAKKIHENSQDFKVTWELKQTDPHADLKAKYEEALKVYDVVKVLCSHKSSSLGWSKIDFKSMSEYKQDDFKFELRFYNIDWNKVLEWSYHNGEFVYCEFSDDGSSYPWLSKLIANANNRKVDFEVAGWSYCRLAPNVTIQDEWLTEMKI